MNRRQLLTMLGASTLPLTGLGGVRAAGHAQPLQGTLPNEDVPHVAVHAFPEEEKHIGTGHFLQLRNGWVFPECDQDEQVEFFDKTRQTFEFDGETVVLDSFDDWRPYQESDDEYLFTHADPPKPAGRTVRVWWDTVYTADLDNPCVDASYEEDDRHAGFPFESTYVIVPRGRM